MQVRVLETASEVWGGAGRADIVVMMKEFSGRCSKPTQQGFQCSMNE